MKRELEPDSASLSSPLSPLELVEPSSPGQGPVRDNQDINNFVRFKLNKEKLLF